DLGSELLPMPEWGPNVAVRIRGLSMQDIWDARRETAGITDLDERAHAMNLEFVARGLVEPKITRAQLAELRTKSSDAVLRLIQRIGALNGSTKEAADELVGEFPAEQPG